MLSTTLRSTSWLKLDFQQSRLEPLIPQYVVNHATNTQRALNIAYNEALHSGVVKN